MDDTLRMQNAWLLVHFRLFEYHPSIGPAGSSGPSKHGTGGMCLEAASKIAGTEQWVWPDKETLWGLGPPLDQEGHHKSGPVKQ